MDDHIDGNGCAATRRLRSRWRIAGITSGWRFPSDWAVPEVDAVCSSALLGGDLTTALTVLGGSRARAGAGLDETLYDVAALHAILDSGSDIDGLVSADPHAAPLAMLRATALGWADVAGEVCDIATTEPDTGLATEAYLRTRLGEVYRRATRTGTDVTETGVLLAIGVSLPRATDWSRPAAMALVAGVLRGVFDGGETTAALGRAGAVVLAERDVNMGQRIRNARSRIVDRLSADPQLATVATLDVRLHRLPETLAAAHALLRHIAARGGEPGCGRA